MCNNLCHFLEVWPMARMVFLGIGTLGSISKRRLQMGIALRYFLNCLIKISVLFLIALLQNLAVKHFASTYDVKILTFVFIGYILIGILIGIDRSLLIAFKNANVGLDWTRLIFYTIPLVITFIFSSF